MLKTIFLGITFFVSLNANAQHSLPVKIVLKTQDTLQGNMWVSTSQFGKEFIYVTSFNEKVKFFDDSGNKRKIKAKEIQELNFKGLKGEERKFVTKKEFKNHIIEVIYLNKIQFYKHYSYDAYNNMESTYYEIFDQEGNQFSLGFLNNFRKKLKKITRQNPGINKFIEENKMNDENILKVIKMYDKTL